MQYYRLVYIPKATINRFALQSQNDSERKMRIKVLIVFTAHVAGKARPKINKIKTR